MNQEQRNQWIQTIEHYLNSNETDVKGILSKIEGIGEGILSKITGHHVDIPDNAKELASNALSVLKDPAKSDDEASKAVEPLQFLNKVKEHLFK
jgi:hypothetical protein